MSGSSSFVEETAPMTGPSMRILMLRVAIALLGSIVLLVSHAVAAGQEAPATLTLEDAIALARRHNPEFRIQRNAQVTADWAAREAYGALLPAVSLSSGAQYQAAGTPTFGLFTAEDIGLIRTPAYYFSNYGLSVNLQLSGATFFRIAEQRASRNATAARVHAADFTLATDVTRQYLAALRARDGVLLAERELETAGEAWRLAQGRFDAGEATRLDVAQAEVDRGRAQVALIQATHEYDDEKSTLLQRIGIELERDIELTSRFDVFEPHWSRDELLAEALAAQPQLAAARAAEDAGRAQARAARMAYLPSISAYGRWAGYTRQVSDNEFVLAAAHDQARQRIETCDFWNTISAGLTTPLPDRPDDCSRFALTSAQERQVLARNAAFPFDFTASPATFGIVVSLPLVDGFTRERNVQTARIAADDARERRRAEELALRARVTSALRAVEVGHVTVGLEERNAAAAGEQLDLARERYRLGAGSILELAQAQAQKASADQRHLAVVYAFHVSLAELEGAVGRRLR
jgi:outer membrane protein